MPTSLKMQKQESTEYKPWKAGVYQAIIKDISDRILEEDTKYNKAGDELMTFVFRILKKGDQEGREVWKDWVAPYVTAPRGSKDGSTLYRILKAVFPEKKDLEIYQMEDPNEMIGCQLLLTLKPKDETGQYCRITDYAPVDKLIPVEKDEEEVSPEDLPF